MTSSHGTWHLEVSLYICAKVKVEKTKPVLTLGTPGGSERARSSRHYTEDHWLSAVGLSHTAKVLPDTLY